MTTTHKPQVSIVYSEPILCYGDVTLQTMIEEIFLQKEYITNKRSAKHIASELKCAENTVTYWLQKYNIPKRTISEAVYVKSNPKGDPFTVKHPATDKEWFLYGLGIGLFWGEGNKVNRHAVRLGNTDVELIRKFLEFLNVIYKVDTSRLRFGLQIFSDVSQREALQYWIDELNLDKSSFQKVVVTKSGKIGTYRNKSQYGVLTIYFSNTKLRDIIVGAINELRISK